MQYRLRTLLILLAVGPMVLAGAWWVLSNEENCWAVAEIANEIAVDAQGGFTAIVFAVALLAFVAASFANFVTRKG
jgi:hypothetical protein